MANIRGRDSLYQAMKTLILAIAFISFMAGATYERIREKPITDALIAEARKAAVTPTPQRGVWMYNPERKTALDEPPKNVGIPRFR